jgi:subtilisin family serine protease
MVAAASTASGSSSVAPRVVVKVNPSTDVNRLASRAKLTVVRPILPSRGIYLLGPVSLAQLKPNDSKKSTKDLVKLPGVVYAEAETTAPVQDDQFHAWVEGSWTGAGTDPAAWTNQPGFAYLNLNQVHQIATGKGAKVALLDTGVDLDQPFLAGHWGLGGYDYVDDDPIPTDQKNGSDDNHNGLVDEAYGHGTHIAGLIALVAPQAEIIPYRVLDADGRGNVYNVAEAINDAVRNGAQVINMSFGAAGKLESKVIKDAIKNASDHDVVIVVAAGNLGSNAAYSPASDGNVIGVGATTARNDSLAAFSNYGKTAFVAAPGENIVSTVPGGGFGTWSGTSMSAAIVSGEVALLRGQAPRSKREAVVNVVGRATTGLLGRTRPERGLIDIRLGLTPGLIQPSG